MRSPTVGVFCGLGLLEFPSPLSARALPFGLSQGYKGAGCPVAVAGAAADVVPTGMCVLYIVGRVNPRRRQHIPAVVSGFCATHRALPLLQCRHVGRGHCGCG